MKKVLRLLVCSMAMLTVLSVVACSPKKEIPEEAQGKTAEELSNLPPATNTAPPPGAPVGPSGVPGQMPEQAREAMERAKKEAGVQ